MLVLASIMFAMPFVCVHCTYHLHEKKKKASKSNLLLERSMAWILLVGNDEERRKRIAYFVMNAFVF
jgi:hypothetical protein